MKYTINIRYDSESPVLNSYGCTNRRKAEAEYSAFVRILKHDSKVYKDTYFIELIKHDGEFESTLKEKFIDETNRCC